jgi:hypothetical protein
MASQLPTAPAPDSAESSERSAVDPLETETQDSAHHVEVVPGQQASGQMGSNNFQRSHSQSLPMLMDFEKYTFPPASSQALSHELMQATAPLSSMDSSKSAVAATTERTTQPTASESNREKYRLLRIRQQKYKAVRDERRRRRESEDNDSTALPDDLEDHRDRPHLCYYQDCDRSRLGQGFPRRYNLFDHMKRVHDWNAENHQPSSPLPSHAVKPQLLSAKRKVNLPPARALPFVN